MTAKIGDLGAARFTDASLSVGPMSPDYVAPERLADRSQPNTARADVYSMGVTFCELFTGEQATHPARERQLRSVSHFSLRDLCLQMASKRVEIRPAASVVLTAVERIAGSAEYKKCPPRRMVKGLLDGEQTVALTQKPW